MSNEGKTETNQRILNVKSSTSLTNKEMSTKKLQT